ncbi:MAG: hypothetical protein VYA34_01100 [Myxococcota bacterium]|nr:hypothetical protein [Myxococcota bacterium]
MTKGRSKDHKPLPRAPKNPFAPNSRKFSNEGLLDPLDLEQFQPHAGLVQQTMYGLDDVSSAPVEKMNESPLSSTSDLREWVQRRTHRYQTKNVGQGVTIDFPRRWATQRGRYANFSIGGSGNFFLVRARASF